MSTNHQNTTVKVKNWILITGCSTGIGRAAALHFSSPKNGGYRVFATVRSSMDEEDLIQSAFVNTEGTGKTIKPIIMDVTNEKSISEAYKIIRNTLNADGSRLVALINNAGVTAPGILEVSHIESLEYAMEVNVFGVLRVTQAFLPLLRGDILSHDDEINGKIYHGHVKVGSGGSRIINVGSIAGLISPPGLGPYCATKYALEALTDSLCAELASQNISVSIIEPGNILTPIQTKVHSLLVKDIHNLGPIHAKMYLSRIESFVGLIEKLNPYISVDTQATNRALEHALLSCYPKRRYLVGLDARILIALKTWLPTAIYDVIVQSVN